MNDAHLNEQTKVTMRRANDIFEGRSEYVSAKAFAEHIQDRPDADEVLYDIRHKCDNALESMMEVIFAIKDACDDDKEVMWQFVGITTSLSYLDTIRKACVDYPESTTDGWVDANTIKRTKRTDADDDGSTEGSE